jgi:hypothetical protein
MKTLFQIMFKYARDIVDAYMQGFWFSVISEKIRGSWTQLFLRNESTATYSI